MRLRLCISKKLLGDACDVDGDHTLSRKVLEKIVQDKISTDREIELESEAKDLKVVRMVVEVPASQVRKGRMASVFMEKLEERFFAWEYVRG